MKMEKNKELIFFYDTSALLGGAPIQENTYISSIVFDELEHIKTSSVKDDSVKYAARSLVRKLMRTNTFKHEIFSQEDLERIMKKHRFLERKNDSLLICEALLLTKKYKVVFITQDACQYLIVKDRFPEIQVEYFEEEKYKENLWSGYRVVHACDTAIDHIYSNPEDNSLNAEVNEYVELHDADGEICDLIKWNGTEYSSLNYKDINSEYFGKIQPRNIQQKMYFDLLQNRKIPIKLCRGNYGTGKTYLALAHAMHLIQFHKFDKLVYIRNNIEVAGSKALGALPGDEYDKLLPYMMPLADHLGGIEALENYVNQGIIEPIHVGFLRGRSFNNSIIFVDEGENLTSNIIKLIVGRVGEGSELWILGDEAQADLDIFKKNSGIATLVNSLKGHPKFGTIELIKPERSAVAQMCDLIK